MANAMTCDIHPMYVNCGLTLDDLVMVVVRNHEQFNKLLHVCFSGKCRYHPEKFPTLFVMCKADIDRDEIYRAISEKMDSAQCQDVRFITLLRNRAKDEMYSVAVRLVEDGATFENNPRAFDHGETCAKSWSISVDPDDDSLDNCGVPGKNFNVYILAVKMRDLSVAQSEKCPYDAAENPTILCRSRAKCPLDQNCDKIEHDAFFGGTKSGLFGCFVPIRLQKSVQAQLQKLDANVDVITIVVDVSTDPGVIRGEIETLYEIDRIDPSGIFTSKLIYEQLLPYDENDRTLSIVDKNLTEQEHADASRRPEKKRKDEAIQKTAGQIRFHAKLKEWMTSKANLHFIYMVYSGSTIQAGLPKHLKTCTVYKAFKNLLLNYRILNKQKICHMDIHSNNITWQVNATGDLSIKLIDFGFNKQYGQEVVNGKPRTSNSVIDVTAQFMSMCNITVTLRGWHPVEYVMFHLCICMMLGPFLVPKSSWTLKHHIDKTNAMLKFVATTSDADLIDYMHMSNAHNALFPNSKTELCKVWKDIFQTYACIDAILIDRWRRICHIVGKLVITKNTKDGQIVLLQNKYDSLFSSNHMFANEPFFAEYFKEFRMRYYSCTYEDMSVINGEFDVFSLGVLILKHYDNKNEEIKHIILSKLFCNQYSKPARKRLTETAEAIQRLEVLFFDLT